MAAAEHDQGCDCSHCKALRILTSETLSMEGKIRKMRELQASLKPPPEPEGEKGDDKGDGYQRGWDDAFERVFQVLREKFTRRAVNTAPNHRKSAP